MATFRRIAETVPSLFVICFGHVGFRERSTLKTYRGRRDADGVQVTVDGAPLDPQYALKPLSRSGFEWGYNGAGPMQLSLAMLADHFGDSGRAVAEYRRYCELVIAELDGDEWTIESNRIDAVLTEVTDVPMTLDELLHKLRRGG